MLRFYTVLLAFISSFVLLATDVTGFYALEYGGAKSGYEIKNVKHVDVNNISSNEAEMIVQSKDGSSHPNVRTLIFTDVISYMVKFVNFDGTVLQSAEMNSGEMPVYAGVTPTREATAQYTYTFIGWDPEIEEVSGSATYTATYTEKLNQYTVKFVNYDGTVLQSETLDYGTTPSFKGENPSKTSTSQYSYTFTGWDSNISIVTGDVVYTAVYSSVVNSYNVSFVNDDNTVLQTNNVAYGEIPVYSGATPTKEATAEFTYTFAGWSPTISAVTGAQTYTATFNSVKNQYEIIFENEDGTELQRSDVTYG